MINFFKQLFSTNPDAKEEENFNLTYLDSRLEEINNKHQKLNGELREELEHVRKALTRIP